MIRRERRFYMAAVIITALSLVALILNGIFSLLKTEEVLRTISMSEMLISRNNILLLEEASRREDADADIAALASGSADLLEEAMGTDSILLYGDGSVYFGISPEEMVARGISEKLQKKLFEKALEMMKEHQASATVRYRQNFYGITMCRISEKENWYLCSIENGGELADLAFRSLFGQLVAETAIVLVLIIYFTRLWKKEKEAVTEGRRQQNFLMNMSHSVRTPLNAMAGYVKLLEKEEISAAGRSALGRMDTAMEEMTEALGKIQKSRRDPGEYLTSGTQNNGGEKRKVLIVDDNEQNLFVLQGLLKDYCPEVVAAHSGVEALEILEDDAVLYNGNVYALIFMDYMMPEMDGIETSRRVHRMNGGIYRKLPIVALTANAVEGMPEKFRKAGMYMTLTKPVDVNVLDRVMSAYVPKERIYAGVLRRQKSRTGAAQDLFAKLTEQGMEPEEALDRLGGNLEDYRSIAEMITTGLQGKYDDLTALLGRGDITAYRIGVHALKSNAYTIGAVSLGDRAAGLEALSALKDPNVSKIVSAHAEMAGDVRTCIEAFEEFIAESAPENEEKARKEGPDARTFEEAVEEIIGHLEAYDKKEAARCLKELLENELEGMQRQRLEESLKKIEKYDYDGAISALHAE